MGDASSSSGDGEKKKKKQGQKRHFTTLLFHPLLGMEEAR